MDKNIYMNLELANFVISEFMARIETGALDTITDEMWADLITMIVTARVDQKFNMNSRNNEDVDLIIEMGF